MISFIKRPQLVDPIERISIVQEETKPEVDPLSLVNKAGKELLEKLRHFMTKQDILEFMYEQELSEEGARKMRRLIFPQGNNQKKAGGYAKNVVDTLQKNLVE